MGKGKMQIAMMGGRLPPLDAAAAAAAAEADACSAPALSYEEQRAGRVLYSDPQLHLLLLQLVVELAVTAGGTLDSRYTDQFPLDRHLPNIPFVLSQHLNHERNTHVVGPLYAAAQRGGGDGAVALLKVRACVCLPRYLIKAPSADQPAKRWCVCECASVHPTIIFNILKPLRCLPPDPGARSLPQAPVRRQAARCEGRLRAGVPLPAAVRYEWEQRRWCWRRRGQQPHERCAQGYGPAGARARPLLPGTSLNCCTSVFRAREEKALCCRAQCVHV